MPNTALVIIHLSSLDSYTDIEYEATGDRENAYGLASGLSDVILRHPGPVFIVDQGWLFIGRESRPRRDLVWEIGLDREGGLEYERIQEAKELESIVQRGPYRKITWIKFDEQWAEWEEFLPVLDQHLKDADVDKVRLGGLFFEKDLSEGCVTHVYKHLRPRMTVDVPPWLVGCVSDFYSEGEEHPGGYTHGEGQEDEASDGT